MSESPSTASATKTVVESIANRDLDELEISGMSVAIMRGDEMVHAEGYGLADRERRARATSDTIYRIASLTKQFTAAGVMKLVEGGKVSLDEPITTYLQEYQPHGPAPTVRHLLHQTAGLTHVRSEDLGDDPPRTTLLAAALRFGQVPPRFEPNAWWSYSNTNYVFLAALIERVSGKAYFEFLHDALIQPLGLTRTAGCEVLGKKRAIGYMKEKGAFEAYVMHAKRKRKWSYYFGAMGLCSTAPELARWTRALSVGKVVSLESYKEMTTPVRVTAPFTAPYGFGLSLIPYEGRRSVSHSGFDPGFSSMLAYFPDDDLTIAVATNSEHISVQHTLTELLRAELDLPKRKIKDVPISAEQLAEYTGVYDDGLFKIRITNDEGRLNIEFVDGPPASPLVYQGSSEFASAGPEAYRLWFSTNADGSRRVVVQWIELHTFAWRIGDIEPDR